MTPDELPPLVEGEYYSYEGLLDTLPAEVVVFVTAGSYQGDYLVLLRRKSADGHAEHGYLEIGYGSCPGCDQLEGAYGDSWDAVNAVRNEMWAGVRWKPADEMREYLSGKDWRLTFYGDEPEVGQSREAALAAVDGAR